MNPVPSTDALAVAATSPERRRSLSRDDRGTISMIGLLCMGAFACLLFALINVGVAVTEKVELQNASDASVLSGATIVARGLNLIALNNNTQAKLLALATIHWGLDRAIPAMKLVHKAYRLGCKALYAIPFGVGAVLGATCDGIMFLAEGALAVWENVVQKPTHSIFDKPTKSGGDGAAWKIMKLLEKFSGILADGIPALAAVEAFRIARVNGAEFGLMIPRKFLKGDFTSAGLFLVDFPVYEGGFRDLCPPAKAYSDYIRKTLAMSLAWDVATDPIAGGIGKLLGGTGVAGAILDGFIAARYSSQCGGSPPQSNITIPASLDECRRSGGTAEWDYKKAILPPVKKGDPPRTTGTKVDLSVLEDGTEEKAQKRLKLSCSQSSPASGAKRVQDDPEIWQKLGDPIEDDDDPERDGRQRIEQWVFLVAEAKQEVDGGSFNRGDKSLPKPYLLGKKGKGEKPSETQERLNYLSVTYRRRPMAVAPNVLKDMIWGDVRLAYAQARVYNGTEFSAFSQDWRVKLVPADLSILKDNSGDAASLKDAPAFSKYATWLERIQDRVPTLH